MTSRVRTWANSYISQGRYTPVGIAFHWVMAGLIFFQLAWGFWSDWVPPGGDKLRAYEVHSAIGLPVLLLAMGRLVWRSLVGDPYNDADRLGLETKLAHVTSWLFYLSFLALPLSGWFMWSSIAPQGPLYLGGLVPWPQVPLSGLSLSTQHIILDLAEDVHAFFVILLLVLIPAHVAGSLKHHFVDRQDVLRAMLPEVPDWEGDREDQPHMQPGSGFPKGKELG